MEFRLSAACLAIVACAACAAEPVDTTGAHLDTQTDPAAANVADSTDQVPSASGSPVGTPEGNACAAAAVWRAESDFAFDGDIAPAFAQAFNALLRTSETSPIAISSHLEPHCVWKAAFSADEPVGNILPAGHAATSTQVLRHPQGLWTASPQAEGWLKVVDARAQSIWIPLADITGSAKYQTADCSALSVRASATIPETAGSITLATAERTTTLSALLGKRTSASPAGWKVRMTFSAELTR
jgi:hypothetical protein